MASDDITVHVERMARRLTEQQEDASAAEQHRIKVDTLRVSRVPDKVRQHNPDAYTPGLVAIGPIHAGDRRLRAGTRLKKAYLISLISRGHPDPARHLTVIQNYVRLVAVREREARAMYAAEDVDISAEDFIQMMVLDGCFIIEHLVNVFTGVEEPSLHATGFGPLQLSVDLILAENQIPFFVLVDLIKSSRLPEFDTTGHPYQPTDLLMKLVLYYLAGEKGPDMSEGLPAANDVCHILHLLHEMVTAARTRWEPQPAAAREMMQGAVRLLPRLPFLLLVMLLSPTLPEESRWHATYGRERLPSASNLKRMWMQFKKVRGGSTGKAPAGIAVASVVLGPVPLYVKLEQADRLRMSQLRIEFPTAPLLLNLMAFEQSTDQRVGDVSAYVWLMAKLVQSPEDAGVLVAAEVVASSGSASKEDVARFFKRVGAACEAAVELEKSYLGEMLKNVSSNQHFAKQADVLRYYVLVPWRLVAAFIAVVTAISSVVQVIAGILQIIASLKQNPLEVEGLPCISTKPEGV